jgi:hypothetical protein
LTVTLGGKRMPGTEDGLRPFAGATIEAALRRSCRPAEAGQQLDLAAAARPTSMRDLFGYRWAFRCTTDSSSDVVRGQGWASEGYTAADIDPLARGVGWLLSESGMPRRIKAAYLTDDHIKYLAAYAARLRGQDAA